MGQGRALALFEHRKLKFDYRPRLQIHFVGCADAEFIAGQTGKLIGQNDRYGSAWWPLAGQERS